MYFPLKILVMDRVGIGIPKIVVWAWPGFETNIVRMATYKQKFDAKQFEKTFLVFEAI